MKAFPHKATETSNAGEMILHPRFHAHANRAGPEGASIINIELPDGRLPLNGYRRLKADNERPPGGPLAPAWLERLAEALRTVGDEAAPVTAIADAVGVSPAHASRRFKAVYGMTPSAFRMEHRLRRAVALLEGGVAPAGAAAAAGFADHSHMCRTVKQATGLRPRDLTAREPA